MNKRYSLCKGTEKERTPKFETCKHFSVFRMEYMIQVPANRYGYTALNVVQLKVIQEVVALTVFAPFAVFMMNQPLKLDYLWSALCLIGAVYFAFR